MRLDSEQVAFFERFARSPEAATLRKVLVVELDQCHARMRTLEGAEMYRAQGDATRLDSLIAKLSGKVVQLQPTVRPTPRVAPGASDVW